MCLTPAKGKVGCDNNDTQRCDRSRLRRASVSHYRQDHIRPAPQDSAQLHTRPVAGGSASARISALGKTSRAIVGGRFCRVDQSCIRCKKRRIRLYKRTLMKEHSSEYPDSLKAIIERHDEEEGTQGNSRPPIRPISPSCIRILTLKRRNSSIGFLTTRRRPMC